MENAFHFTLKGLFILIFNFYLDFLVMQKNSLIRNIRLISNFMMPQLGEQTIAIHILSKLGQSDNENWSFN